MTELSKGYPGNPPRFRKGRDTPADTIPARCETCESFNSIGYCVKYQLPVFPRELCDSFVSVFSAGKRQFATR